MADTRSTTGVPEAAPVAARPERVGRYEPVEQIGEGGMGVVWSARDPELGRVVAVKLLKHATSSAAEDRLRREAKTMARLVHPNVIRVYDVGVYDDGVFLAMEYVDGGTLKDWLAAKPRDCDDIRATFVLAGEGLAAAHAIGLVHRDVKPSNVLVGKDGRVLVTDFGLARSFDDQIVGEAPSVGLGGGSSDPLSTITRTGGLVGTPAYMAPEQRALALVDARSDQFSFAVALWSALYGTAPFADPEKPQAIAPPPAGSKVPVHVRASLERALAVEPARRFATMRELLAALTDDPRKRRRRLLLAAGATAAIGGAAAVWWLMPQPPDACTQEPERFDAVWDASTREAIHAAFMRTQVPYATAAFGAVVSALDTRRATWTEMSLETCHEAQRSDTMQMIMKPRRECLDKRLADLAAYVATLRTADASTVKTAGQASATIGDPRDCDNPALGRVMQRPQDPTKLRAIEDVDHELATVRADIAAGHYKDLEKRTTTILARARETSYPPIIASALYIAGRGLASVGQPAKAEKLLDDAVLAAESASDDTLRFDCEALLARTVGMELERIADGERHAQRAEALLVRIGDDRSRAAALSVSRATVLWWGGRYDDARAQAAHAVELYGQLDNAAGLASALHIRGIVEQEVGDAAASVATMQKAIEIGTRVFGESHPALANLWNTSGGSLRQLKRYDEARAHLGKSLAILEANGNGDAPQIADAVQNIATTYLDEGKPADAIPLLERAVAISTRSNGAEHSRTADVLEILGTAQSKAGRAELAVATLQRAIDIHRARLGPDSPATASSVKHLGYHYVRVRKFAEARAEFLEAIRALEASQNKTSPMLIKPLIGLGDAETGLAHKPAARAAYERARGLLAKDDDELRAQIDRALEH